MNHPQKGFTIQNATVGITQDGRLAVECNDEEEAIRILQGISTEGEPSAWERQGKMLLMSPQKSKK